MASDSRLTQERRLLVIETPLGRDELLLQRLSVSEAISRPFLIEATVLGKNRDLKPADLIGKGVTCTVRRPSVPERHFHGIVRAFSRVGLSHRGLATYRIEAVPRLWNLSRTADCRIFQDMSVADIVKTLVDEGGASPVDHVAQLPQAHRTYTVQFNETDLDFLQRLLDEIGFAYFFRHEKGQHTLVLTPADNRSPSVPGGPAVVREDGDDTPGFLSSWGEVTGVGPTSVVAHDHDLLTHSQLLRATTGSGGQGGDWEVFQWPGGQAVRPDASPSRVGMEAVESGLDVIAAAGSHPAAFAGGKLAVRLSADEKATSSFLLTEVQHAAFDDTHLVSGGESGYSNNLSLIPAKRAWRSPVPRPRPIMPGLQSAIVTGPSGEEVHCDKHGRIRVRFLWDRKGKTDDRSSCWIRVAQPWAGNGRGFWALPRVGDEVLVAFVDGDPDRPVAIGSLYGAEAEPPFPLPANATQTGILTRSSKGGAPANASMLRFEDKKGEEEVTLQAERDLTVTVERDATSTVKRHRAVTISEGNDKLEVIQGNIGVKASAGAITIEAARTITLKVGSTTITLDPQGVQIKAMQVQVKADMMVQIESGGMLNEKAGAVFSMSGALIKLN